jgi:hypothetical protein
VGELAEDIQETFRLPDTIYSVIGDGDLLLANLQVLISFACEHHLRYSISNRTQKRTAAPEKPELSRLKRQERVFQTSPNLTSLPQAGQARRRVHSQSQGP